MAEAQRIGHRERVALRKLGNPENFRFFRWECVGDAIKLTGCVTTQVYSKGPRKGRPKYEGKPQIAIVVDSEESAERLRWEAETGKCGECLGESRVFAGWHHITGTSWKPCPKCRPAEPRRTEE